MIKKLTVTVLISVIFLSSCLRDDIPSYENSTVTQQTINVESDTAEENTTEESTMEEYPDPVPVISESLKVWLDMRSDTDGVIMTFDEITAENERICADSDVMTDILSVPDTLSRDDIIAYMKRGNIPVLPRYDTDGTPISTEYLEFVVASMRESDIPENVVPHRGIVTSRANLRAIPDSKPYRKSPTDPYDTIQQTELHVATPVWVVWESTDGHYFLVVSSNYVGWVKAECVAVTDSADAWMRFASPESFGCIIDTSVKLDTTELDMGVTLPLVSEDREYFTFSLPVRAEDGSLSETELRIVRSAAVKGYLDFTYENFISQAFKYEGVMYSWGGLDTGVDCSGFISNVLHTFGFRLPRDTKDQQNVVGSSVEVKWKTHAEITEILENTKGPTAVYYPGHVLFYLGHGEDGKYYFIHAPQIGESVSVTAKTSLIGITYICEFTSDREMNEDETA